MTDAFRLNMHFAAVFLAAAPLAACGTVMPRDTMSRVGKTCTVVDTAPDVKTNDVTKSYTRATYDFKKSTVTYDAMIPNKVLFGPNSADDPTDADEAAWLNQKNPRTYTFAFEQVSAAEKNNIAAAARALGFLGHFQCPKPELGKRK